MEKRRWGVPVIGVVCIVLCWAGIAFAEDLNCADCHDVSLKGSVHEDGPSCTDCHSDVKDDTHAEKGVKKVDCTQCHDDKAASEGDIHKRIAARVKDKQPSCASCHGSHQVKPVASITDPAKQVCGSCHDNVQLTSKWHERPFVPSQDCLDCHDKHDYKQLVGSSVHQDFACADCHQYVTQHLEDHTDGVPMQQTAQCGNCHAKEYDIHKQSIHGISLAQAIDEAAKCWNCHGSHDVKNAVAADSPVNPRNLPDTCGKCHGNAQFEAKFGMGMGNIVADYKKSVHGQLTQQGSTKAPSCSVCHDTHNVKNRVQPGSTISAFNVPDTCGQCHTEIAKEYKDSIHWVLAKRGVGEAPVCDDCHSEHSIERINSPNKRAEIRKLQNDTCIRCHQDPILARKFNLDKDRAGEYLDSYHGLAVMRGDPDAAMCVDCHGVHRILPKSSPDSLVNPANVVQTCQKCHPNATEKFSRSYAHNAVVVKSRSVEYAVKVIYLWMIVLVIGGMIFHNLVILGYELREHAKRTKKQITLTRFTRNEVAQHLVLMLAFTFLALTGFALKYPEFPLFKMLSEFGLTEPMRQLIHRGLGVVLLLLGIYHIVYLFVTKGGRNLLKHMFPKPRDLRDMIDNVLYHVRVKRQQPEFTHFNYVEKSEYWALIWGTMIMGATGFILWFPTVVGDWAPIWLIRVCELIHYYEAILATLAILVWHLFFVMYHPKEYPVNLTFIDGKVSLDTFKHHYRHQYKEILRQLIRLSRGQLTEEGLSYDAQQFLAAVRSQGVDCDELLASEAEHDPEVKSWLSDSPSAEGADSSKTDSAQES